MDLNRNQRLRAGLVKRWTTLLYVLVGIAVTGVMVGLAVADVGPLHSANFSTLESMFAFRVELQRDLQQRWPNVKLVEKAPIVLVTFGDTVPTRDRQAALLRKLVADKARVVGFDVFFRLPKGSVDTLFAGALRASHRAVLQYRWADGDILVDAGAKTRQMPVPAIANAAAALGYANVTDPDDDNIYRRATLMYSDLRGNQWLSWPAAVAKQYLGYLPQTLLDRNTLYINYVDYPRYDFPSISFDYFFSPPEPAASLIKDKIVLIGSAGEASALAHDTLNTPISHGERFGVDYMANVINTIVTDSPIIPVDGSAQNVIVIILGLLTTLIAIRFSIRGGALLSVILIVVWAVFVYYMFLFHRVWLNVTAPALAVPAAYLGIMAVRYFTEEREKRRIRNIFSHYVSPQVVNRLVAQGQGLSLAGQRKEITVMFSDIRGFTTLSESLEPEQVVGFLNKYFEQMAEIVFRYGGTLDKYVGDAVMALWNAPDDVENGTLKACQAALEMQQAVDALRANFSEISSHYLEIGIGINVGPAIVGTLGSGRKKEYTAIGDTVNVASRLEGLNKQFGTGICISGEVLRFLPVDADVREQGEVAVKGRSEPVQVLSLHGLSGGTRQISPAAPELATAPA